MQVEQRRAGGAERIDFGDKRRRVHHEHHGIEVRRLLGVTPRPRQAFLLVALEGFSEGDAARILDVDVVTLRSLIEESGRELAAEIATDRAHAAATSKACARRKR